MSSTINEVIVDPFLSTFTGYTPPDPTYGRYLQSTSPYDLTVEGDPNVWARWRRVFFRRTKDSFTIGKGEDVTLRKEEIESGRGKQWVFYKIWERVDEEAKAGPAVGCDLVMLHGMNDYGGKYGSHAAPFLAAGYRVIVPDMITHGRSTGVHVCFSKADELSDSVCAVLNDLRRLDAETSTIKKTFMTGSSLGGWTCLSYCLRYTSEPSYIPISGIFLLAPLIGVAPESMPDPLTRAVGAVLKPVIGRLPLAPSVKGHVSDDPRVEEEFDADPRGYHGYLRISTGFALLEGFQWVQTQAEHVKTPIRIIHGSHDRATDHKGSVEFIQNVKIEDKQCEIYDGYEHIMLKVGVDAADDAKRQRVLADMKNWFGERLDK